MFQVCNFMIKIVYNFSVRKVVYYVGLRFKKYFVDDYLIKKILRKILVSQEVDENTLIKKFT